MQHPVAVPYDLVRVGDVIDRPGRGSAQPFDVITHLQVEKVGQEVTQVILSVSEHGERHRLEWWPQPDTTPSTLGRVGRGCAPTPRGLRYFIAYHRH